MSDEQRQPVKRPGLGGKAGRFSSAPALKQASASLSEGQAHDQSKTLFDIPLDKIIPDPKNRPITKLDPATVMAGTSAIGDNPAKRDFYTSLVELAASIKKQGLQQPIKVYRHGDSYRLIFGECRWLAHYIAGKETIRGIIEPSRPKDLRQIQAVENLQRHDVIVGERVQAIRDMLEEEGVDLSGRFADKIMEMTGLAKTQSYDYQTVIKCDDKGLVEALTNGSITTLATAIKFVSAIEKGETITTYSEEAVPQISASTKTSATGKKKKKKAAGRRRTKVTLGAISDLEVLSRLYEKLAGTKPSVDWDSFETAQKDWDQLLTRFSSNS